MREQLEQLRWEIETVTARVECFGSLGDERILEGLQKELEALEGDKPRIDPRWLRLVA